MFYVVVAFPVILGVLFVATDVSLLRSRKRRWWHFSPWSPLLVGGVMGIVVVEVIVPAISTNPEQQFYPIIAFAVGSAVGAMYDEVRRRRRN